MKIIAISYFLGKPAPNIVPRNRYGRTPPFSRGERVGVGAPPTTRIRPGHPSPGLLELHGLLGLLPKHKKTKPPAASRSETVPTQPSSL